MTYLYSDLRAKAGDWGMAPWPRSFSTPMSITIDVVSYKSDSLSSCIKISSVVYFRQNLRRTAHGSDETSFFRTFGESVGSSIVSGCHEQPIANTMM